MFCFVSHRSSPAFNKEIYVDFMGAQIKTLAFSAYIIRLFQDVILTHAPTMVKGMLNLLESCPKEVAHLRKELLVATRHILATDLRNRTGVNSRLCLYKYSIVSYVFQILCHPLTSFSMRRSCWARVGLPTNPSVR